jgi:thiol:disulfide interchange protein
MNVLAQLFGLLAAIALICSIQMKNKKTILIFMILGNGFFVINFIILHAYSGALICLVATIQTIISYIKTNNNKDFPRFLIFLFLLIFLICGLCTYKEIVDIIPIICSILFSLLIIQKKESNIRILTIFNALTWIIYDILVGAYTATFCDIFLLISAVIAIFRYDLKKAPK